MTLIDRLSKLDGPDREVDAEIAAHFRIGENLPDWAKNWQGEWKPTIQGYVVLMENSGNPGPNFCSSAYTASVDAAIALADRLFPGTEYEFTNLYNIVRVTIELNGEYGGFHGEHVNSLPIAICIALLRAKEASNGK